mmetsp:Transcript_7393/g.16881  ORF Transcript_7393/g.16881 Transcript_7393/m.16881 type:complete len:560 (-) Transcript_7393:78-1757(-)
MRSVGLANYEGVEAGEDQTWAGWARQVLRRPGRRPIAAVAGTGVIAAGLLVASSLGRPGVPMRADARSSEELFFGVAHFPDDCGVFLRVTGCKKEAWWSCDAEESSNEWKCCCQDKLWLQDADSAKPKRKSLLRLMNMDTCLSGPRANNSRCELADCRDELPELLVQLPEEGSGNVKLSGKHEGRCLAAGRDGKALDVANCDEDAPEQQFKLENSMLQWAKGKGKCLDVDGDRARKGSKVLLADCTYWPKKSSPQFEVIAAPRALLLKIATGGNDQAKGEEAEEKREPLPPPKLYCTSIMMPRSSEVELLKAHLNHAEGKVGIFACDLWSVYSNERVELGRDEAGRPIHNSIMNGSLKVPFGGRAHTALNTPVFRRFWSQVITDGKVWAADWIVKVDPDAVFLPMRLKDMLRNKYPESGTTSTPVYLNNCHLGLHGPIEVFNRAALGSYKNAEAKHQCDWVANAHPQEDVFMDKCFQTTGVQKLDAFNILLEWKWACFERSSSRDNRPPCFDNQVSFHPFKTVKSYFKCYNRAMSQVEHYKKPMLPVGELPSPANHHHS